MAMLTMAVPTVSEAQQAAATRSRHACAYTLYNGRLQAAPSKTPRASASAAAERIAALVAAEEVGAAPAGATGGHGATSGACSSADSCKESWTIHGTEAGAGSLSNAMFVRYKMTFTGRGNCFEVMNRRSYETADNTQANTIGAGWIGNPEDYRSISGDTRPVSAKQRRSEPAVSDKRYPRDQLCA